MNKIVALGYLAVTAGDTDAWERFATSLLGLQLAQRRPDGTCVFRLDDYAYRFAVEPGSADDVAFIGWEVRDDVALDALASRLRAHGVAVTADTGALATDRCVQRLITFHDPDGTRHEAFTGPLLQPNDPFVSPRSIGPFVTGDQGLGHVVLVTGDLERQQRFFCEVIGFRLSDTIDAQTPSGPRSFTFLHCSRRHHSLAFARIPSLKRLAHVMFQTSDLDDVGLTCDVAQRQGHAIVATLGRHTNDRMFSFYVRSPSGWEVEFGADAVTLDDGTWHVRRYDRTSVWGHDRDVRPVATAEVR